MAVSRDERLVETALDMALASRRPAAGWVHHADRGSQYTATAYRSLLACYGIVMSMSGKGEPYDNALRESFFGDSFAPLVGTSSPAPAEYDQRGRLSSRRT